MTDKVRALEIAQVNHRKQQAIAMAALAAEKLKGQKMLGNEFQSDSNLHYSMNKENNKMLTVVNNNNINKAQQQQQQQPKMATMPMGKRLLLKVFAMNIFVKSLYYEKQFVLQPHLSLDSGMIAPNEDIENNSSKQINVSLAPKTAPATPLGAASANGLGNLRKAHLSRTNSGTGLGTPFLANSSSQLSLRSQSRLPQRSSSQKYVGDRRPGIRRGQRSVSPQPRIITSTASVVEDEVNNASKPPKGRCKTIQNFHLVFSMHISKLFEAAAGAAVGSITLEMHLAKRKLALCFS